MIKISKRMSGRQPPIAALVLAMAVLAGVVLAWYAVAGHARPGHPRPGHPAAARRAAPARQTPVALPSPAPSGPAGGPMRSPGPAARPGVLQLVAGSRLVNGIHTDYPHSLAGAVSAAVEFTTELGSTLDPDQAASLARLTAVPSYRAAPADAAAQVAAVRRRLGLPGYGAAPPGTAVALVPVMYQVRDAGASQPTVLLLFDYTQTAAAGITEHLGVTAVRLGWTPGTWRLLPPASGPARSGGALSGLLARPGTDAAAAKGWKAMTDAL